MVWLFSPSVDWIHHGGTSPGKSDLSKSGIFSDAIVLATWTVGRLEIPTTNMVLSIGMQRDLLKTTLGFAQKCRKHHVMAILMGKWGLKPLYVGLFPCFSQHVHPCSIQPRPMFNMAAMCHGRPSWWDWGMVIPPWSFVFWTHISAVQSLQAGATDLLRHRWCKSALPNLLVV